MNIRADLSFINKKLSRQTKKRKDSGESVPIALDVQ